VQLDQASRHVAEGRAGLQPGWMQIASAATMVKLGFFALTCVLLLALAAWLVVRRAAPAS